MGQLIKTFFGSDSPRQAESSGLTVCSSLLAASNVTLDPGCKLDEMPILIGPQGVGKSTFYSSLLPSPKFFSDNLNLGAVAKDQVEALGGNAIIECPELVGIRGAKTERLKAFLSRQVDKIRPAYGHYVKDHERRCIIVGSTNDSLSLPNDPTGNRRFIPIRVEEKDGVCVQFILDFMEEYRDQIWAEGLVMYKQNPVLFITPDLVDIHRVEAEQHRNKDFLFEDSVHSFIDLHVHDEYIWADQFTEYNRGMKPTGTQAKTLSKILGDLGWGQAIRQAGLTGSISRRRVWLNPHYNKPKPA